MMKYRHFCHDWDGLEIDETCPEFACCTCYDGEEVKIIKDKLDMKTYSTLMTEKHDMIFYLSEYAEQLWAAINSVDVDLESIRSEIETALCLAFPLFTFGNGGSAAVAEHVVADLVKCVAHDTCLKPFVMNLASNSPLVTCIANDYDYASVFAKQLDWYQQPGSLAIGISSSGNSPNIIQAFRTARINKMKTIAFVGFDGGRVLAEKLADTIVHVRANNYGIVEDAHMAIFHALIQKIRLSNCENPSKIKL